MATNVQNKLMQLYSVHVCVINKYLFYNLKHQNYILYDQLKTKLNIKIKFKNCLHF